MKSAKKGRNPHEGSDDSTQSTCTKIHEVAVSSHHYAQSTDRTPILNEQVQQFSRSAILLRLYDLAIFMAGDTAAKIVFKIDTWFSPKAFNRHHPLLLVNNDKWKYTELIVTDYSIHGEMDNPDQILLEHGFLVQGGE
jgi:hypothetical protein